MKNNKLKPMTLAGLLVMSSVSWADNQAKSQQELDAINQSDQGLEVVTHADGSQSVNLEGRFQMYSTAKLVNGKVVYSCQNKAHNHTTDTDHKETKPAEERGVK